MAGVHNGGAFRHCSILSSLHNIDLVLSFVWGIDFRASNQSSGFADIGSFGRGYWLCHALAGSGEESCSW